MAQVKHKQQYRSKNESYTLQRTSRSKGKISIVGICEEITDDSNYRLQKIGALLINARIRKNDVPELSRSPNVDKQWVIPKLRKESSPLSR